MQQSFDFQLSTRAESSVVISGSLTILPSEIRVHWKLGPDLDVCFPFESEVLAPAARKHKLWERTCFELFVRQGERYTELNLSPLRDWNCYSFTGERVGMTESTGLVPLSIHANRAAHGYDLTARLHHNFCGQCHIGVCAVLETATDKHFLALHHPGPIPDFHNPDGHVLVVTL